MAIRDTVARGARKQVRQATGPLRRELRRLRVLVGQLRRDVSGLKDSAARWRQVTQSRPWHADVSDTEVEGARLSPGLVKKLRTRLGISQAALGRLVGVTGAAVVSWEQGRSSPAPDSRRPLIALRRRGRRDVRRLLEELPPPARPATRRTKATNRRVRRRRKAA